MGVGHFHTEGSEGMSDAKEEVGGGGGVQRQAKGSSGTSSAQELARGI